MDILKNANYVTPVKRRAIVFLAMILTLTSVRVQAAEASDVLPNPPAWVNASNDAMSSAAQELSVPPVVVRMSPAPTSAPVTKVKWNTVNAPDLTTKPEHSSESSVRTMVVPTTAYTSDPGETDASPFTTADGSRVRDGIIAANFLPIGTRVRIPEYFGDKVFEVHDRMNARYNQRVDIWMTTKTEAFSWGVRRVKIEILP